MRQDIPAQFAAEERAELERVVEALAHWPRLSGLLHYMGDKLSAGEVDHLNEYNIASEVLGRSKTVFNAAEDAIARVEAHRLRKRLTAFYQSEGRDDPIQVSLPAGSYVPVFLHKPAGVPSSPPPESDSPGTGRHLFRSWNYWVPAGSLVLATLGVYPYFRRESSSEGRRLHLPWPWQNQPNSVLRTAHTNIPIVDERLFTFRRRPAISRAPAEAPASSILALRRSRRWRPLGRS